MGGRPQQENPNEDSNMDENNTSQIIEHIVGAINTAAPHHEPFPHLQLANIFPTDIYSSMMEVMPAKDDYRHMSGRTKSTRNPAGGGRARR